MKSVFKAFIVICSAIALLVPCAFAEEENDGQDPTRPLTRFDIRTLQTVDIPIGDNEEADQTTVLFRIDKPMVLENNWTFYWRTDVPVVYNDVPSMDNPDGDSEWGMGDWFNQFIMIAPPKGYPLGIQTYGVGFQVKLDTASQDQFGAGRNRFVPLLAWKWKLSDSIDLIPVFKYEWDFGDKSDGETRDVENFQFKPIINVKLPDRWFLSLYDSTDIVYQNNGGPYDGKWNVPIDVMVGKRFVNESPACFGITNQCVYSLQYIDYIVDDANPPDWQAQARIGWFF